MVSVKFILVVSSWWLFESKYGHCILLASSFLSLGADLNSTLTMSLTPNFRANGRSKSSANRWTASFSNHDRVRGISLSSIACHLSHGWRCGQRMHCPLHQSVLGLCALDGLFQWFVPRKNRILDAAGRMCRHSSRSHPSGTHWCLSQDAGPLPSPISSSLIRHSRSSSIIHDAPPFTSIATERSRSFRSRVSSSYHLIMTTTSFPRPSSLTPILGVSVRKLYLAIIQGTCQDPRTINISPVLAFNFIGELFYIRPKDHLATEKEIVVGACHA